MLTRIAFAILISGMSAASYAYVIGTHLNVENKTDTPLTISITQPNGQEPLTQSLPAHQTRIIYMENGDHGGLLYQTAIAPFTIRDKDHILDGQGKIFAQGRIVYYVGASVWNKYSYLNAVTAADNMKIKPEYSCKNGGSSKTFENNIVIEGTPGPELEITTFPDKTSCEGLKSSELVEMDQLYTATCFDGITSRFYKGYELICTPDYMCLYLKVFSNGEESYPVGDDDDNPMAMKVQLDKAVGNPHCGTW